MEGRPVSSVPADAELSGEAGRFPARCPLALTFESRRIVLVLHLFRAVQTETVRLLGCGVLGHDHVHVGPVVALGDELHRAGGGGEEGMVAAHATVFARKPVRSTLAEYDVTGYHKL